MKVQNIHEFSEWFEVIQTSALSQVAMMQLAPGQETGSEPEAHDRSDQVLLVIKGSLQGEVADQQVSLQDGQFVLIPAGTMHRFVNKSDSAVLTFNVYAPPAYPPDAKG